MSAKIDLRKSIYNLWKEKPHKRDYLRGQLVFFELVAKTQDADPVWDALDAGEARKLAVQRGLEQGLLTGQVTQAEPLLEEMNAQYRHTSNSGHPVLERGVCGAISGSNSVHGTNKLISSRNTALRVRRVLRFRPRSDLL